MKKKYTYLLSLGLLAFFLLGRGENAQAQDQDKKVIQLSGIVLNADSTDAVPNVNIYVPKKGRGTTSNLFGFFSMPVLEGDTVVFTYIGLQRQTFVVPSGDEDGKVSLILTMMEDEITLGQVEVMPFPTEEEFKRAVLALNLEDPMTLDRGNLSPQLLLRYAEQMPASGNENFRYFQSGQMQQTQDRYGPRSFQLLNPFAWSEFIKSIKRGDLKSKD